MGRVLTIGSQKGGVGKTTIALNLAYAMGRFGVRTLLVDLDPQSGTSIAVNLRNFTELGVIDALLGDCLADDILAESRDGALAVAGIGKMSPQRIPHYEQAAWDGRLVALLNQLTKTYHYVVLDAPAGLGGVVQAALKSSQGTVLVSNCSAISLKSISSYLQLIDHISESTNPQLVLEGVLLSIVDVRSEVERTIYQQLEATLPTDVLLETVIPYSESLAKSSYEAMPAALLPDAEDMDRLFTDLAMELRERERVQKKPEEQDGSRQLF